MCAHQDGKLKYRGVRISLHPGGLWYAGITKAVLPSLPKAKEITRAFSTPQRKQTAFNSLLLAIDGALGPTNSAEEAVV